jgi:anti-sigma factor RsiW
MAELHPENVELLELVEEELPAERRSAVSAHVAACARCAESVRLLEAGRAALREAPRLELAPRRREAIVAGLPHRERPQAARRRLVAVLAAVAVVAALAAVAVVTGPDVNLGDGQEEAGKAAETAVPEAAAEGAEDRTSALSQTRLVAGPASEVAELLRQRGFDARVVGDHVEVRNADPEAVERALAHRRPGAVRIVVK